MYEAKTFRKPPGIGNLNTRQVVKTARPGKHVGADSIGSATYLSGHFADVNREALPERGKIVEGISAVSTAQSCNQERPAVFKSWHFELYGCYVFAVVLHLRPPDTWVLCSGG
jgi:hypothetical protein